MQTRFASHKHTGSASESFSINLIGLTRTFAAHRKALQLLRELVRQRPQDIREAVKAGLLGTLGSAVGSDQADVREAALALLALLVQHPGVIAVSKQVTSMPSAPCCHPQGYMVSWRYISVRGNKHQGNG